MIVSVISYIVFYLWYLSRSTHLLHCVYYCLISWNRVTSYYDPLCLVLFTCHIEPLALLYLIHLEPWLRICVQYALQHLLGISCQHFGLLVLPSHYLFVEFICVGVLERKVTAQHSIEDDSTWPNINVKTLITFSSNHLRSSIARWSTSRFKFFPKFVLIRQAKINNLNPSILIKQ